MYKNIRLHVLFFGMMIKYHYKAGDNLEFVLFSAADGKERQMTVIFRHININVCKM